VKYKKYTIIILISTFLVVLSIPVLNIIVDPSRVIQRDYCNHYGGRWPNIKRNVPFLRTAYLIDNQGNFDSIMFGSSRLLGMPLNLMGKNWYKFNYGGGGRVNEHLYNLRILIDNDVHLENIWMMDGRLTVTNIENNKKKYNRRYYPDSLEEMFSFYQFYLFRLPDKDFIQMLTGARPLTSEKNSWLIKNNAGVKIYIKENKKHEIEMLNFKVPENRMNVFPGTYNIAAIRYIKEAYNLCKENNIKFKFFLNPYHYKVLLLTDINRVEACKKKLAKEIGFYDFNSLNNYTTNNKYWKEWWHFLPSVGEQMIAVLNSKQTKSENFGIFVDSKNAGAHLDKIRRDIYEKIPGILMYDKNVFLNNSYLKGRVFHEENLSDPNLNEQGILIKGKSRYIEAEVQKKHGTFKIKKKINIPKGKQAVLKLLLKTPTQTMLTVKCLNKRSSDSVNYKKSLRKGEEYAFVPLNGSKSDYNIHISFEHKGIYKVKAIEVIGLL